VAAPKYNRGKTQLPKFSPYSSCLFRRVLADRIAQSGNRAFRYEIALEDISCRTSKVGFRVAFCWTADRQR
jgi:hypothetical protein